MAEQEQRNEPDRLWKTRRRRAGIVAFVAGVVATLALFAFVPGLPHVIDWGAILMALLAGALARWTRLSRMTSTTQSTRR
ncbi:hypothetical protein ACIRJO_10930 [Streptomyces sp. NPDC102394]|uniref:hypothetical protein n=1 Tax=Streptomyces sp. NPDC102394 TaxID=3366167 RepID=UPI0038289A2D